MIETISREVANCYLQKLISLHISAVQKIFDGTGIHIGVGQEFYVDTASYQKGKLLVKKKKISQFALCLYGEVFLSCISTNSSTTKCTEISRFHSQLLNQKIRAVDIGVSNQICIVLDNHIIISSNDTDSHWTLCQPKTQEDELFANHATIERWRTTPKRWSLSQPANRDQWHLMNELTELRESFPLEQIERTEALRIVSQIIGATLQDVMKSYDLNLCRFAFAKTPNLSFLLVISCAIKLVEADGKSTLFYGDTSVDDYQASFAKLTKNNVTGVSLQKNNVFSLEFGDTVVEFIVAGDGKESWRFIAQEQHIVASNTEIWKE